METLFPCAVKVCTKCGREKPLEEYARNRASRDGYGPECLVCKRKRSAGYYARWTPEQRLKHRGRVLKARYGITLEDLTKMYERQEGCCAICARPGKLPATESKGRRDNVLHVEHDHKTGKVRGLVCVGCNLIL